MDAGLLAAAGESPYIALAPTLAAVAAVAMAGVALLKRGDEKKTATDSEENVRNKDRAEQALQGLVEAYDRLDKERERLEARVEKCENNSAIHYQTIADLHERIAQLDETLADLRRQLARKMRPRP